MKAISLSMLLFKWGTHKNDFHQGWT
jgi:hypothetical protein